LAIVIVVRVVDGRDREVGRHIVIAVVAAMIALAESSTLDHANVVVVAIGRKQVQTLAEHGDAGVGSQKRAGQKFAEG
jgi:hypothetical protein